MRDQQFDGQTVEDPYGPQYDREVDVFKPKYSFDIMRQVHGSSTDSDDEACRCIGCYLNEIH